MRFEPTGIARRAAIRPLIRAIDESCSDWIRLDISADVQELDVTGDCDGAISLLVNVSFANRPISPVKSTNLRTGQPVHVGRKRAALVGAQYQVEVIRHRAVDEQRYVESLPSIPEQSEKLPVIMGIPEDAFPPVSAVDDMLNASGNNLSADSRHRVVTSFFRRSATRVPLIHPLLILCPGRLSLVWGTVPIRAKCGTVPNFGTISGGLRGLLR